MGGILRESGGFTGMSGALNSQQRLAQQQMQALMNAQMLGGALTSEGLRQMQALRQGASAARPRVDLPNGGLGLLPKDLLTETVQADNVSERIDAAVKSYQESREQEMRPSQQPDWANGFMQTAFFNQNRNFSQF